MMADVGFIKLLNFNAMHLNIVGTKNTEKSK